MTENEVIRAFTDAMRRRDIVVPQRLVADGKLHRCDAAGRHGKGDAAYVLHLDDLPAGGFQNHRDGEGWENWHLAVERQLTAAERETRRRRMAQDRAQGEEDLRQRQAATADRAGFIWTHASPANGHAYLVRKHVQAHGLRVYKKLLIVPVIAEGAMTSLQLIDEAGGKRFLTDGRKAGGYHCIGSPASAPVILIAEGFATAATLYEASGYPTVIAFDAGNLPKVAQAIRQRFPAAKIVIAADDDHHRKDNPGRTKAREAAAAVGGVVAIPDFGSGRPDGYTDFNDLAHFAGHDRVREIIDAARVAPSTPRLLTTVRPTTLNTIAVPERDWLVPDWIPMRRATGLYGAGGEGKTILAQMLATASALGKAWLDLPTFPCNSILLFCEDDLEEMHRRQADINAHYGCTFADLGGMLWLPRLGDDNTLGKFEGGLLQRTPLFEELLDTAKDHDAQLVIIDTLADIFSGNENDRGQARAFAQQTLGFLARAIGGAALALAHPSRAGVSSGSGDSGSTGWVGTFRSQLYLATPRPNDNSDPVDPDLRTLTRRKSNNARRGDEIELRWENGVFRPTRPSTGIIGSIERKTAERVFLDLLDKTAAEGQPVSSASRSGNFAPRLFASRPDRERFTRSDFERAMQALFASGQIINVPYGRKGDERTRLARRQEGQHD